jgi:hypothetical protein
MAATSPRLLLLACIIDSIFLEDDQEIGTFVMKRLKSAASVMQSAVMGFGFGPVDAVTSERPSTFNKRT